MTSVTNSLVTELVCLGSFLQIKPASRQEGGGSHRDVSALNITNLTQLILFESYSTTFSVFKEVKAKLHRTRGMRRISNYETSHTYPRRIWRIARKILLRKTLSVRSTQIAVPSLKRLLIINVWPAISHKPVPGLKWVYELQSSGPARPSLAVRWPRLLGLLNRMFQ